MRKLLFALFCLEAIVVQAAVYTTNDVDGILHRLNVGKAGDVVYVEKGVYDFTGKVVGDTTTAHFYRKNMPAMLLSGAPGLTRDDVVFTATDSKSLFSLQNGRFVVSNLTVRGIAASSAGTFLNRKISGASGIGNNRPLITDCVVSNCTSAGSGGAATCCDASGSYFYGCESGASGGALYCQFGNGTANFVPTEVSDCTFVNCVSTNSGGACFGGLHRRNDFHGCGTRANASTCHGGGVSSAAGCKIYDCSFYGCFTSGGSSHAAAAQSSTVTNCIFIGNKAVGNEIVSCTSPVDCTFIGNKTSRLFPKAASLTRCTILSNKLTTVMFDGGGVVVNTLIANNNLGGCDIASAPARIYNCTIANNHGGSTATTPAHSVLGGGVIAVNTILSGNSPRDISGYKGTSTGTHCPTMTNCLWTTQNASNSTTKAVIDQFATNCKALRNPKFIETGDHPYMIRSSSPARDEGYEDEGVRAAVGDQDLAKGTRRMFKAIDIGCYELQKLPGLMLLVR